jgi:hypothetical protein
MLGAVVRDLHAHPYLRPDVITDVLKPASGYFVLALAGADLDEQPELVRFTPENLTVDEMAKLWSLFPDTSYRLSVAYAASVVLVESVDPAPAPLARVLAGPTVVVGAGVPAIDAVDPPAVVFSPTATIRLRVRDAGDPQKPGTAVVQFPAGDVALAGVPGPVIEVALPANTKAGENWVRVVTTGGLGAGHTARESNVATFILNPRLAEPPAVLAAPRRVRVKLEPKVFAGQNVALELTPAAGLPLLFPAASVAADADVIEFPIPATVPNAEYLVRVRVDDGETAPTRDPATGAPTGPKVTLT